MEYNGERIGAKFGEVAAAMLSYGHWDHAGGLTRAFDFITHDPMLPAPRHVQEERNCKSWWRSASHGEHIPSPEELKEYGAIPVLTTDPCVILEDMFYISSEIERVTSYEKGMSDHKSRSLDESKWEPDPLFMDERLLAVNIKDKGLVIFSAFSHAGIVNIM